jgi:hypothetical protein
LRLPLVEEILLERGIVVSGETAKPFASRTTRRNMESCLEPVGKAASADALD